jgi:Spy/CpxP family protein refolding chaperone
MKLLYIILFVILVAPVFSNNPARNILPDIRKQKAELELTNEQIEKLDKIYNNYNARTLLQAPAPEGDFRETVKKRMEIRREMRQEIAKVLTPEQRKAYIQLRQQQKAAAQQKQQKQ